MKKENLCYAIFALLVIIFCVVTAMRVFIGESLHVAKQEKKTSRHQGKSGHYLINQFSA